MKPHQILIYDAILDGDSKRFREQLTAAGNKPVELRINSVGGLVFEGYAIYNALLAHKAGVEVFIDGIAASMASYIAMAGTRITMAENAMLMIHNPSGGSWGDADDMRRQAELLDKITASIIDAYTRRSKQPRTKVRDMMDDETWLTAEMALDLGFIDEISAPLEMAAQARFDIHRFKNPPTHLFNMTPPITAEALAALQATLTEQTTAIAAATTNLANLTTERDAFKAQLEAAHGQVADLNSQVSTLTTTVTDQVSQLAARDTTITGLTGERDKAAKLTGLIESFCKAKGIDLAGLDRTKATFEVVDGDKTTNGDDILAQYDAITDPTEQTRFYRAHAEAYDAAFRAKQTAAK